MQQSSLSLRDEALLPLTKVLTRQQISTLLFEDVAVVDQKTKYIEARRHIPIRTTPGGSPLVQLDEPTVEKLDNYMNAQQPGRPFLGPGPAARPAALPARTTGRRSARTCSRARGPAPGSPNGRSAGSTGSTC